MSGERPGQVGATAPSNPYIGLRPYKESESQWFFGRDADRKIFVDMVLANRLTLLFAASGVGKSSLLQAAVLPQLKDSGQENLDAVYCNNWAGDPLVSIRQATLTELVARGRMPKEAADAALGSLPLPRFFQVCSHFCRQPLVIVLDQFEEFFHYHRGSQRFPEYKEQLVRLIIDESLPIAVVISMREDFALALNAFKPDLPTLLFNKFYRLEKLTREDAELAIVQPAQLVGFRYEPELLAALLADLAARDRTSRAATPVADTELNVEPPYLQIVCSQLFELSRGSGEPTIKLATYRAHGGAQGLLASHIDRVTASLSYPERRLASQCFSHLITRRGTKVAHTVDSLAHELRVDRTRLEAVLRHLESARLLRSQSQDQATWYELYHDLFSESVDRWNDRFRSHERLRKTLFSIAAVLATAAALFAAYVAGMNHRHNHLRLSRRERSKPIELYRGDARLPDLFHQQTYVGETGIVRKQIAPDQGFDRLPVAELEKLYIEAAKLLPTEERLRYYQEDGQLETATELALGELKKDDEAKVKAGLKTLARLASATSFRRLEEVLKDNKGLHATLASLLNQDKGEEDLAGERAIMRYDFPPSKVAVSFFLKILAGPPSPLRAAAAGRLGEWRVKEAEPQLLDFLCRGSPGERSVAATALGQIKSRGWPLPCSLAEQSEENLLPILQMLGTVRAKAAVPELLKLLETRRSVAVRRGVVQALGSTEVEVRHVERWLADPAEEVAVAAGEAAARRGFTAARPALVRLRETTKNYSYKTKLAIALAELGEPGPLGEQLAEPRTRDSLFTLSDTGLSKTEPISLRCLLSIQALPILATNAKVLEQAMTGADVRFQKRLLTCLGNRFPTGSTALLRTLARAPDIELNRLAAQQLVDTRDPDALNILRTMLDEKVGERQRLAAELLGKLDLPGADEVLARVAFDAAGAPSLRVAALRALARPEGGDCRVAGRAGKTLLAELQATVADLRHPDLRTAAAATLAARAPGVALAPLIKLLDDPAYANRDAAIRQLLALRDRSARRALEDALARVEARDDISLTAYDDMGDRAAIARRSQQLKEILGDGGGPILTSREELRRRLIALGETGILVDSSPLLAALRSPYSDVRMAVLESMNSFGEATWRENVVPLLEDGEQEIQVAAMSTLASIARPVDLPLIVPRIKQSLSIRSEYGSELRDQLFNFNSPVVLDEHGDIILKNYSNNSGIREKPASPSTMAFLHQRGSEIRFWQQLGFDEIAEPKLRVQAAQRPRLALYELSRGLRSSYYKDGTAAAFSLRTRTFDKGDDDTDLLLELLRELSSSTSINSTVIIEVTRTLAKRGERRALKPLVDGILSPYPWLRSGAWRDSLKLLTQKFGALSELHQIFGSQRKYASLLAAACDESALRDLRDPQYLTVEQRVEAATIISGFNGPCSDQVLVPLARDPSVRVRVAAATAMGGLKSPKALDALHVLLKESNPKVQLAAAKALAETGSPASLPAIGSALQDTAHIGELPILVTQQLLLALQKIGTPEAIERLMAAVEADQETVGLRAYRILGDLKAKAVIGRLHAQLDKHRRAAAAFRSCRDYQAPERCTNLAHPSSDLLFELGLALARIQGARDEAAIALLGHELADVREGAALGLALQHDAAAVEMLDRRRHDSPSPLFRHAAYRAIDMTLAIIEALGGDSDLQILERIRPLDQDGVKSRIEWTVQELKGYLGGQTRAAGAAN